MSRRVHIIAIASLCAGLAAAAPLGAQDDARDALRVGKYQEAITLLQKVPPTDSDWASAQRDLARAYATVGKYDMAENTARRAAASRNGNVLWNPLGEILMLRGKREAAESAFVLAHSSLACQWRGRATPVDCTAR